MLKAFWRVTTGVAIVVAAVRADAQGPGPRAYVLDQGARTLTAMEIATGRVEQSAKLEGAPTTLLRTANGQRFVVLDRGEGKDAGSAGFQAKTRSTVTILDASTLAVRKRVELGWGLDSAAMLSASGDRLSVMCPGYRGKTPAESLAREIVTVDLAAGTVISRLELSRTPSAFFATPDGGTAIVLSPRETPKKSPALPAELRFVDLTSGTVSATVTLEGDPGRPVLAPDGDFLYLLDPGKPNSNPEKNVNGRLYAVSMKTRAVQGADVGSKPRGLVLDERRQQLLLLSDGTPVNGPANKDRPGELRVIRGGAPGAPIPVVSSPERLEASADGKTIYVLGQPGLTRLTVPALVPSPMIKAPGIGGVQTAISADGRRRLPREVSPSASCRPHP